MDDKLAIGLVDTVDYIQTILEDTKSIEQKSEEHLDVIKHCLVDEKKKNKKIHDKRGFIKLFSAINHKGLIKALNSVTKKTKEGSDILISIFRDFNNLGKKIEVENLQNLDTSLGLITGTVLRFGLDIVKAVPVYFIANRFMPYIGTSIAAFINIIGTSVTPKTLEKTSTVFSSLSDFSGSVRSFFLDLAKSLPLIPLAQLSIGLISNAYKDINSLVKKFSKIKDEELSSFERLSAFATNIRSFAMSIALATPFLILAYPGIVMLNLASNLITNIISNFAQKDKEIKSGTSTLFEISKGLLVFTGTMALVALGSAYIISNIGSILGVLGLLYLTSVTYNLIANMNSDGGITNAAWAVAGMSLSLLLFTSSLTLSSLILGQADTVGIIESILTLGILATEFYFIGTVAQEIALGSLAMFAVGISMLFIAAPLSILSGVFQKNPAAILEIPIALAAIGSVFALFGQPEVALFVILGAAAFAAIGGSLWVIGKGLQAIFSLPVVTRDQADGIKMGMTAIMSGLVESVTSLGITALTLPLVLPLWLGISSALPMIAKGVSSFQDLKGWSQADGDGLKNLLTGLVGAFATAGSSVGMASLLGFNFGDNDVERGIESTMKIGTNLKKLADGVMAWKNMKVTEEDINAITANVSKVLNSIPVIFALLGQRDRGGLMPQNSLWGNIFGADLQKGDIELGISSTQKLGENLKNLADGILAWKTMKITEKDLDAITYNVSKVLNTIPSIFATIGQRDKGGSSGSLISSIFGSDFSKGDIEQGIQSTEKLGTNLKNLADGIMAWSSKGKGGITSTMIDDVKVNVQSLLSTLPKIFADIGKQDKDSNSWFTFDGGDIEKGIDLVTSMSKPLISITDFIKSFKDVGDIRKFGLDAYYGIRNMFGGIFNGISLFKPQHIKLLNDIVSPLERLGKAFTSINTGLDAHVKILQKIDKNYINTFTVWANSLKTIADMKALALTDNFNASQNYANINFAPAPAPSSPTSPVNNTQPTASPISGGGVADLLQEQRLMNQKIDALIQLYSNDSLTKDIGIIKNKILGGIDVKPKTPL